MRHCSCFVSRLLPVWSGNFKQTFLSERGGFGSRSLPVGCNAVEQAGVHRFLTIRRLDRGVCKTPAVMRRIRGVCSDSVC